MAIWEDEDANLRLRSRQRASVQTIRERKPLSGCAEFVGLVQVFVYIGAVAVLIVFTILLTRRDGEKDRGFNWSGVVIAVAVFGGLIWAITKTKFLQSAPRPIEPITVQRIGELLMTSYVWPLLCVGVLLTAALIGALILVMEDKRE